MRLLVQRGGEGDAGSHRPEWLTGYALLAEGAAGRGQVRPRETGPGDSELLEL